MVQIGIRPVSYPVERPPIDLELVIIINAPFDHLDFKEPSGRCRLRVVVGVLAFGTTDAGYSVTMGF